MKKILLLLVLLALPVTSFAADKETAFERFSRTGVLRCGYIVWQPYMMKDPNTGKLSGMSYDIFETLARNLGFKIEWASEVMVGQQVAALETDKVDAVCGDWPINSRSARFVQYTDGFAYFPVYLYQKKGSTKKYDSLADVNSSNVSISAMDGDISLLIADKKFPNAKKVEVPATADPTMINLNATTGKADLASNDPFSVSYFNAANKDAQLEPVLNDKPLVTLKTAASVRYGEHDLVRMLNEGIQLMITSGEVDDILDKYDPKHQMLKRPKQPWQN